MDHASTQRFDVLERGVHFRDGEIGQRRRVAGTGATFVNAERWGPAPGLPATTFGFAALSEFDAEQS